MRVTIYQPQYFPRLHYYNRIIDSDTFVILDSTQYTKALTHLDDDRRHKSYQSDTPIKIAIGEFLLTVPIKHQGLLPINQTKIDYNQNWARRHLLILKSAYAKSAYFKLIYPQLVQILSTKYDNLATLNINTILWGIAYISGAEIDIAQLSIDSVNTKLAKNKIIRLKKIITDKDIGIARPPGAKKGTQWTANICKALGATEYFHGETAKKGYMELDHYKNLGISPIVQNWTCSTYSQQFILKIPFLPNLSIIDLLFNVGGSSALEIILSRK